MFFAPQSTQEPLPPSEPERRVEAYRQRIDGLQDELADLRRRHERAKAAGRLAGMLCVLLVLLLLGQWRAQGGSTAIGPPAPIAESAASKTEGSDHASVEATSSEAGMGGSVAATSQASTASESSDPTPEVGSTVTDETADETVAYEPVPASPSQRLMSKRRPLKFFEDLSQQRACVEGLTQTAHRGDSDPDLLDQAE